jgi:hypothetical protein
MRINSGLLSGIKDDKEEKSGRVEQLRDERVNEPLTNCRMNALT